MQEEATWRERMQQIVVCCHRKCDLFLALLLFLTLDDVIVIDSDEDVKGERGEGVKVGGGSSSEEEAVVILTEQDVGGFSKRGGRKGRGKRREETAAHITPEPAAPETAGRGKQTKRKKRRKKQ